MARSRQGYAGNGIRMSLDELLLLSGASLAIGALLVAAPIGGLYSVWRRRLAAAGAEDA